MTSSFQAFVKYVLALSLLNDESDLDEATTTTPITKKEIQLINRKLNVLVR